MVREKIRAFIPFLVLAFAGVILLSSCSSDGESTNEFVYLHVYNGYPGSGSVSVYGPTGPLVNNMEFANRTDEPIRVNRNLGTEFRFTLRGTPGVFNVDVPLFTLYPGETATLFIGNRAGENTLNVDLFRHIRSASPFCRIVFHNALAVQNAGLGNFNYIPGWYLENLPVVGYDRATENQILDTIENQLPPSVAGTIAPVRAARNSYHEAIADFPYFVPVIQADEAEALETFCQSDGSAVRCQSGDRAGGLILVWIGDEDLGEISIDFDSGAVITIQPSYEFIRCMLDQAEAAIEAEPGDEVEPPDFGQCLEAREYSAELIEPGADEQLFYYYHPSFLTGSLNSTSCDAELRLFSDFSNIFDGTHGYDGWTNNVRVDFETASEFGQSEHYFFVVYGFPVNPRIAQWNTSHPRFGYSDQVRYPNQ